MKKISVILPSIIAIALIIFVIFRIPINDLEIALQQVNPIWFPLIILLTISIFICRGYRYKLILSRIGTKVSTIFSTSCYLVSQTVNLIIPARLGDLVRIIILKHEKETTYTKGVSSLVAERTYDILTVGFLGFCSIPFIFNLIPQDLKWIYSILIGVLALGGIIVCIVILAKNLHPKNKIIIKILEVIALFRTISSNIPTFLSLSGFSIVSWLIDVCICYVVSSMFGISPNFFVVLLAVVVGNLIKAIPITPGGIGTYELALVVIFEVSGIPTATATLIAITDHLIKNGLTLLGGIISTYYYGEWLTLSIKNIIKKGVDRNVGKHN